MEIGLSEQIIVFVFSILFGVFLRMLFDVFKLAYSLVSLNTNLIFRDILYFSLSGILTFLFLLASTKGEFKFFIILGEIIGWIIYHLTIGKITSKLIDFIILFLKRTAIKVKKVIFPLYLLTTNKLKSIKKRISLSLKRKLPFKISTK